MQSVVMLSVVYAECCLCWVSQTSPACWVSLCWESLSWVSSCWMTWRPKEHKLRERALYNWPPHKGSLFFEKAHNPFNHLLVIVLILPFQIGFHDQAATSKEKKIVVTFAPNVKLSEPYSQTLNLVGQIFFSRKSVEYTAKDATRNFHFLMIQRFTMEWFRSCQF